MKHLSEILAHSDDGNGPRVEDTWREAGFGLYVHWPFCESKCPYCDFNSHVAREFGEELWKDAYRAEIARLGALTGDRILSTVFFGGGTPSLMSPELVDEILTAVRKTWSCSNSFEVTLEANPSSVEAGRFRAIAAAGVNRISIGVQALNDPDLRRLGRLHSAAEARHAVELALSIFDRVSMDLIYARLDQSVSAWEAELSAALALAADHLSLYQLTIEDGTTFGALNQSGKLRGLPDESRSAEMFAVTQEICADAGMPAYEISNHAANGGECRHNLIYWRSGDYAAIGPGAHGRLTLRGRRFATEAIRNPTLWLESVSRHGHGDALVEPLTDLDVAREYLIMGLRLVEGIDLDRLDRIAPGLLDTENLRLLQDDGFLYMRGRRLGVTDSGRLLLDALLAKLV